jgi:hypothetical protein
MSQTSSVFGIFSSGSSATGGACGKADLHGKKGVVLIKFSLQSNSLFALFIKLCCCAITATRKEKGG